MGGGAWERGRPARPDSQRPLQVRPFSGSPNAGEGGRDARALRESAHSPSWWHQRIYHGVDIIIHVPYNTSCYEDLLLGCRSLTTEAKMPSRPFFSSSGVVGMATPFFHEVISEAGSLG